MHVRMSVQLLQQFRDKCRMDLGKDHNDMIRELMQATIDDRVTIQIHDKQKGIYNVD